MKKLTEGKPIKVILLFSVPILLGQIFQMFYNIVDTRIVGQILGEEALAAVGATTSLSDLLVQFIFGITNGFAIISANFYGAKDIKKLKKSVASTLLLGGGISVVLSAICLLFITPLLKFLQIDDSLMVNAKSYIGIIIAGLLAAALYNVCASTLRAIGDSVTPLMFLIFSAFLNIFLDYGFIAYLHLGVSGAAYATVLSQVVSVVLCVFYVFKKYPDLIPGRKDFILEKNIISKQMITGISMGFMSSFVNLGTLCLQTQINSFGADIIVSHTASRKLHSLVLMPFFVLAVTLSTFSAQNMGAGKLDRIREGLRDVLIFCVLWSVALLIGLYLFTPFLIKQIIGMDNAEIIATSVRYMRFSSYFYFICAVICTFRNAMQGFGDSVTPIISSFLELFVKVLIAFLLVPVIGYDGVIVCEPIAWIIMVIPLIVNMMRSDVYKKSPFSE